jgi:hypothetical protein
MGTVREMELNIGVFFQAVMMVIGVYGQQYCVATSSLHS